MRKYLRRSLQTMDCRQFLGELAFRCRSISMESVRHAELWPLEVALVVCMPHFRQTLHLSTSLNDGALGTIAEICASASYPPQSKMLANR